MYKISTYEEQLAWDMFYSGLVGIQFHPANPPDKRLTLDYLAIIADQMMKERDKRCR